MKKIVEVRSLKTGGHVIIDNEPCRIVSISTSQTGKHGSAKARIEAIGIFDDQKRSLVKPVDSKIEVPIIEKKSAQVIAVMENTVQLMDLETYDVFELEKPKDLEKELVEGAEIEYWISLDKMKVSRVK
ncbi:MAG: translation initiation factor IF-5A [Candidatus Hydrothermarchaeota archaeon]